MSRAHDKTVPCFPETKEQHEQFENIFRNHYDRILNYLSMKVDRTIAEDLTQQVFMKAMVNLHTFREQSSLFTWIFKIAQNTLKNEYRKQARQNESVYYALDLDSQFISVDFTKNVEVRIDIQTALRPLNKLDQQIVALRFFLDCSLIEISEITGLRMSALKNRLYRALRKVRNELENWSDFRKMSIEQMIAIVNKQNSEPKNNGSQSKVYQDIMHHLKANVDRIISNLKHQPSQQIVIEIYPDLKAFHRAAGETDAPNWFMGTYKGNKFLIASPLDPGPEHTYESILKSTIHLFAMWLVNDINPHAPKYLRQGIGGYEAKQMTEDYIKASLKDSITENRFPSFDDLENDTWDFGTMHGFQFSYKIVEFIVQKYGLDHLNKLVRNPSDFEGIFHCPESELHRLWVQYLKQSI